MNKAAKSLFTIAAFAILNFSHVSLDVKDVFCGDSVNLNIDHALPVSHANNRCANQQSQAVSWSSWFTGRSSSYQFHFIDLLELLSRSGDHDAKNLSKTSSL